MKNLIIHITVLLLLLASCRHQTDDSCLMNKDEASPYGSVFQDVAELTASQPDSALSLLAAFSDTLDTEKMSLPDYYEYQILVAEALYKNDYLQTNDSAVNEAVKYYDSLTALYPGDLDLQYKKARAYYYKGVGDTEKDDIVEACKDYLKALEVMESELDGGKLDGRHNHFMALTYNRLATLFFDCDAYDISMQMMQKANEHFKLENDIISIARNYTYKGEIYYISKDLDSALICYDQAGSMIQLLDHIDYILLRDIMKCKALILHDMDKKEEAYNIVRKIILDAVDEDERMAYYYVLGEFYYNDRRYDSALYYLEECAHRNKYSRIGASDIIIKICRITGDDAKAAHYASNVSGESTKDIECSRIKAETVLCYKQYEQSRMEQTQHKRNRNIAIAFLMTAVAGAAVYIVFLGRHLSLKRKNRTLIDDLQKKDGKIRELEGKISSINMEILINEQKIKADNDEISSLKTRIASYERKSDAMQRQWKERLSFLEKDVKNSKTEILRRQKSIEELQSELDKIKEMKPDKSRSFDWRLADLYDAPVCQAIFDTVNREVIKSNVPKELYRDLVLSKEQTSLLYKETNDCFPYFSEKIKSRYPRLTSMDLMYCHLYFLGLDEKQMAALTGREYRSVRERAEKLHDANHFDTKGSIQDVLFNIIKNDYQT